MRNLTVCLSGHRKISDPVDIRNTTELEIIRQIKLEASKDFYVVWH